MAFVTGATSGIGRGLAVSLLDAGAHVIATGRRSERLVELQQQVSSERLLTCVLDVQSAPSLQACLAGLPAVAAGRLIGHRPGSGPAR